MLYLGETISLVVAFSWTITALCSEVASKRLGALQLNVIRMLLSLCLLSCTMWIFTGSPFPLYANTHAWMWLLMSGLVGYVFGDYCLFNSYILIGSRFGQLFMTLAPPTAAFASWVLLGEHLQVQAWLGMGITLLGIGMSVLNKGKQDSHHRVELKLPLKGVLFGVGAGVGQGLGLVLSKLGMNYYEAGVPEGMDVVNNLLPFASTFIRAIAGSLGFLFVMAWRKEFYTLSIALKDRKGMKAAVGATLTGPFIGVSLSLMAVQYTEAGIASTLMALVPVLIIWPAHLLFKQEVKPLEIVGAVISVIGASLFFL